MFTVLDTNHFVALVAGGELSKRLLQSGITRDADFFLTVITVQEITQGWLAAINRENAGPKQVYAYSRFFRSVLGFSKINVLPFDEDSASQLLKLQDARIRIGTMDLKIAATCIAHDALLLSRNLVDFEKVPGLRVENWLD